MGSQRVGTLMPPQALWLCPAVGSIGPKAEFEIFPSGPAGAVARIGDGMRLPVALVSASAQAIARQDPTTRQPLDARQPRVARSVGADRNAWSVRGPHG